MQSYGKRRYLASFRGRKKCKVYEKDISNPIKQSYRQCRRMEELFRDFDITATVYPVLYFVDSRTELKIVDDAQMNVAILSSRALLETKLFSNS